MNYTENYNLILPEQEDYYDVDEFNQNMEVLDGAVAELSAEVDGLGAKLDELDEKLSALDSKIGTQGDNGTDTVYGLLKSGTQVFKSWHRYVFSNAANTSMGTITLTESVNPERCIVLTERLRNTTDQTLLYDYVLTDSKITVSHQTLSGTDQLRLGFTVVELY